MADCVEQVGYVWWVDGGMFVTVAWSSNWQGVKNKLDISGGWVNVCEWGRSSMWQSVQNKLDISGGWVNVCDWGKV